PTPAAATPSTPGMTPPVRNAGEPGAVPPLATQPPPTDASSTPMPASPLLSPIGRLLSASDADVAPPGAPPAGGRPRPGSLFDPGAAGPGIDRSGAENFLDGALDPRTGWPFVFLDHFRPRPERLERFWIVSTRDCPQVMGSDPWACLKVLHFDDRGNLVPVDPSVMLTQTIGHPVFIQVQGSLTTPDVALGGLLWTHTWLQSDGVMRPDTVVIAFDWPSQRVYRSPVRDIEEKGRRAYIAGFHLARFVQGFPAESQVSILGQSYGGRVVPSALHLLGGGALNSQDHDPYVRLPALRPDLHVRAIILGAASDHNWLVPGQRLDHVLHGCEGLLNLYNSRDEALRLYPFLRRSGHHHAIGKVGLKNHDFARLGSLASRYCEHDIDPQLGDEHTLLDAVANRQIARWMAPYLFGIDPGPLPERAKTPSRSESQGQRLQGRSGFFGTAN
ncbi:MAG TPA: hypothetical protein VFT74_12185, partial [Isosphaeraceae bacterium]|nr:hypothetical protein [Isosphaeraceae bacterium]